jgi:Rrf2 family protein
MLSGTAEYALRAVVYLARQPVGTLVNAGELADETGVPRNYLSKILHDLGRAGILTAVRGKHGGFKLALPPEQLKLHQVVSRFDSIGTDGRCLLGRPECSNESPCPMHHRWKGVADQISQFFNETTLADVLSSPPP